ncbi:glycoside hydrolase family 31 protein [Oscillospiraceae bacterium HV4-5-C5C]|nr:glycoside hydrolase family 31 protein [Oscillospiraceae bacterium HV4-5-C5C]
MIKKEADKIWLRRDKELLCVQAWGENGIRVRATQRSAFKEDQTAQALLPDPVVTQVEIYEKDSCTCLQNGQLICEITQEGHLRFLNQRSRLLLEEYERNRKMEEPGRKHFNSALEIDPRTFTPYEGMDQYKLTVRFEPQPEEKIYGMGQYQEPYLDLKGCTLELAQRNSQASVPFALSSLGYGFLWNNPAIGQVTFAKNVTEWTAQSTKEMDYWVTAGATPADILRQYTAVTGRVPEMPDYGLGFWQCKLRYQTQEELLAVAREYHRRHLPLDVIVIDFFHWPHEGDWTFDPVYWPDPAAMVHELDRMGIRLMVSVWPTVEQDSVNYPEMLDQGFLTRSDSGKRLGQLGQAAIFDATNPAARHFVWGQIKANYFDKGIHIFWLDEAEPELTGYEFQHYRYLMGPDMEVGNIFPREYARMAYEGMTEAGQQPVLNLLRCAWAGSQRYGALVWSGDIDSSFRSLRNQLRAGLNMGLAGIPWWTTDIGGFHGGNIADPNFKELLIRWFEFGAFCPVMRLHGYREPFQQPLGSSGGGKCPSGAANEVWSYGEEAYEIFCRFLKIRRQLRPYLAGVMHTAHESGAPVIRPLFYDFPDDPETWEIDDMFMLGPDILVAPILAEGVRSRRVYLPAGTWRHAFSGEAFRGQQTLEVAAPLDQLPVWFRSGAELPRFE